MRAVAGTPTAPGRGPGAGAPARAPKAPVRSPARPTRAGTHLHEVVGAARRSRVPHELEKRERQLVPLAAPVQVGQHAQARVRARAGSLRVDEVLRGRVGRRLAGHPEQKRDCGGRTQTLEKVGDLERERDASEGGLCEEISSPSTVQRVCRLKGAGSSEEKGSLLARRV